MTRLSDALAMALATEGESLRAFAVRHGVPYTSLYGLPTRQHLSTEHLQLLCSDSSWRTPGTGARLLQAHLTDELTRAGRHDLAVALRRRKGPLTSEDVEAALATLEDGLQHDDPVVREFLRTLVTILRRSEGPTPPG